MAHSKKQVYISQNNIETAQVVFELVEETEGLTFSDFVWEACRLSLAHRGELPIAVALRPMLEEVIGEALSNVALSPEKLPRNNKKSDDFFSIEEIL